MTLSSVSGIRVRDLESTPLLTRFSLYGRQSSFVWVLLAETLHPITSGMSRSTQSIEECLHCQRNANCWWRFSQRTSSHLSSQPQSSQPLCLLMLRLVSKFSASQPGKRSTWTPPRQLFPVFTSIRNNLHGN